MSHNLNQLPEPSADLVAIDGRGPHRVWYDWLRAIDRWIRQPQVPTSTVANLPSAVTREAGALIFVSNESGGAVLAYSDGTNWRRVTDRAIVT